VKKQNCWEFKHCGRGPAGKKDCAAANDDMFNGLHGGTNAGRACWVVAGTCGGVPATGMFAIVSRDCLRCDFFKLVENDEQGLETGFSVSKLGMMRMLGSKKPFLQNGSMALKVERIEPHLQNEFAQEVNKIALKKSDASRDLIEEFAEEVALLSSNTDKKSS
jgi:hypothetical protein